MLRTNSVSEIEWIFTIVLGSRSAVEGNLPETRSGFQGDFGRVQAQPAEYSQAGRRYREQVGSRSSHPHLSGPCRPATWPSASNDFVASAGQMYRSPRPLA